MKTFALSEMVWSENMPYSIFLIKYQIFISFVHSFIFILLFPKYNILGFILGAVYEYVYERSL